MLSYEHVLRGIESSWVQIGLKIEVDGKWQKGQPEQQCRDMLGVKSSLSTRPRPNLSPRQVRNLDDPICKSVDKDFNEISIRFICRKILNHPNQYWSNSHETLLIFRNMWSSLSILGSELRFFFCKITLRYRFHSLRFFFCDITILLSLIRVISALRKTDQTVQWNERKKNATEAP